MAENPDSQLNTGAAGDAGKGGQPPADQGKGGSTLLTDGAKPDGGAPKDGSAPKDGTTLLTDGADGKKDGGADGKPGDKPGDNKDGKTDGAPEKYTDFSAPEGVELDPEMVGEFTTVAKELNLSQENAQKLVDFGPKLLQKARDQQNQQWVEIREGWVNDLKADKDFGGEKLNETLNRAKRALSKFGDDSLVKFLMPPSKGGTGFGDHGGLIKLLAKVDKATSEDSVVDGDPSTKDQTAAATLYPNQGKA